MQRIAILRQPDLDWPVIVATDATPGATLARHWPDYPEITGLSVEGTPLLALNEQGVFAAIAPARPDPIDAASSFPSSRGLTTRSSPARPANLDRAIKSRDDSPGCGKNSSKLLAAKRNPFELVLDMLDHPDAADAAQVLRDLDPQAYRPFTLAVGDNRDCYFASNWIAGDMQVDSLPAGVATLGAGNLDIPAGLQPMDQAWRHLDAIVLALPGLKLFGREPCWKLSAPSPLDR